MLNVLFSTQFLRALCFLVWAWMLAGTATLEQSVWDLADGDWEFPTRVRDGVAPCTKSNATLIDHL